MSLQDVKDKIAADEPLLMDDLLILLDAAEEKLDAAQAELAAAREEDFMAADRATYGTPSEVVERLTDIKTLISYAVSKKNEITKTVTQAQIDAVKVLVVDLDL